MLLALSVAAIALAGCTNSTQGSPTAVPIQSTDSSPGKQPSATSGPTVQIPPRPKELKLDDVEPCKLFTKAQLDQLKIDREPRSRTSEDHFKAPTCALDVQRQEPSLNYDVLAITTEGIEPWLTGKRNVDAKLVSVGGFPAADFKLSGGDGAHCRTAVGVADGQQLLVDLSQGPERLLTQDQLCQMSEQAAGMALQTLQTLK